MKQKEMLMPDFSDKLLSVIAKSPWAHVCVMSEEDREEWEGSDVKEAYTVEFRVISSKRVYRIGRVYKVGVVRRNVPVHAPDLSAKYVDEVAYRVHDGEGGFITHGYDDRLIQVIKDRISKDRELRVSKFFKYIKDLDYEINGRDTDSAVHGL